ncbi:hypothetical protein [Erwinia phage vB_Ea277G]|nr:hypothetical protein [Erwinia phage vB_Ea277G]
MRNIVDLDKVFNQHSVEYTEREWQLMNQSFFLHLSDVQSGGTLRSIVSKEAKDNERLDNYLSRNKCANHSQEMFDKHFKTAVKETHRLWLRKRDITLFATGATEIEKELTEILRGIHHHFHTPPTQFLSVYSEPYQLKERLRSHIDLSFYNSEEVMDVLSKVVEVFNTSAYPTHTLNFNIFVVGCTKPALRAMFVVLEDLLTVVARELKMVPGSIICHVQKITSSKLDVIEASEAHHAIERHLDSAHQFSCPSTV